MSEQEKQRPDDDRESSNEPLAGPGPGQGVEEIPGETSHEFPLREEPGQEGTRPESEEE